MNFKFKNLFKSIGYFMIKAKKIVVAKQHEDYNAKKIDETTYLLSSNKNSDRLKESIKQYENSEGKIRDLINL